MTLKFLSPLNVMQFCLRLKDAQMETDDTIKQFYQGKKNTFNIITQWLKISCREHLQLHLYMSVISVKMYLSSNYILYDFFFLLNTCKTVKTLGLIHEKRAEQIERKLRVRQNVRILAFMKLWAVPNPLVGANTFYACSTMYKAVTQCYTNCYFHKMQISSASSQPTFRAEAAAPTNASSIT